MRISRLIVALLMFGCLCHCDINAQPAHLFKHPANTLPKTLSWWDSIYLYPEFKNGVITYFTGFSPERELRLNYNLYFAQMDLIDEQGDTVQIQPSKTFKSVSIGDDVFMYFPKEGYLRVLTKGDVTLAERALLKLVDTEQTVGIRVYGIPDVRGRIMDYDRYYMAGSEFYFIDANGKPYIASRPALNKILPEYKSAITSYVSANSTDFALLSDLREITEFCNNRRRLPSGSDESMIVRANEGVSHTMRSAKYQFDKFQDGVVIYQDGRQEQFKGALNYNLISGEMDMIKGADTTQVDARLVTTANLDGTTYYKKSEGYMEVLLSGYVMLVVVRRMNMVHSQAPKASSKYQPRDAYDPSTAHDDKANFDRLFEPTAAYYLIDPRGTVYKPSTQIMYRLYPSRKKEIDAYIASHDPDMQSEEDLRQFLSYLTVAASK